MRNFPMPRERHRAARWATRIDPNYTLLFGCKELHSVFFASNGDSGGVRTVIVALMPEAPEQLFVNAMELASRWSWRHKAKHVSLSSATSPAKPIGPRAK